MKVYIVLYHYFDDVEINVIFDSKAKADDYIKQIHKEYQERYSIEEHDVN